MSSVSHSLAGKAVDVGDAVTVGAIVGAGVVPEPVQTDDTI